MNLKLKKIRGFTLIELMVAIAIVAVLATIGFSLLQTAQAQARDARRKGDIDAIATVLENKFNASAGTYAAVVAADFAGGNIPVDPLNTSPYVYSGAPAAGATTYILCARLEKKGGNASGVGGAYQADGDFYCRKNQQQ